MRIEEKTEKQLLTSRSLSASSVVAGASRMSRTPSQPELENHSSTRGQETNGDHHRTAMATAEMCAKQLSQLPSPQRCRTTEQLNNTRNWTCNMSVYSHALRLVNKRIMTEIFTENLHGKPRIGAEKGFRDAKVQERSNKKNGIKIC